MNTCKVKGCSSPIKSKNYCQKHYMQYWRYGYIKARTKKDPNEIIIRSQWAEIVLYNQQQDIIGTAKIDIEDLPIVSKYRWTKNIHGYITATGSGGIIILHKLVFPNVKIVDHINRIKSDCRKSNLRECDTLGNSANKSLNKNNSSGYSGIAWDKDTNKWRVRIGREYKRMEVGRFKDIKDAIIARKNAERQYFGEFAPNY